VTDSLADEIKISVAARGGESPTEGPAEGPRRIAGGMDRSTYALRSRTDAVCRSYRPHAYESRKMYAPDARLSPVFHGAQVLEQTLFIF